MKKLYKCFLYVLPLTLCFSYFPVISFGGNETMNFELSLPFIWLVLFDLLSFVMICRKYRKELFSKVFGSLLWWLFPIFVTLSVIWSLNPLREVLTSGVMWLLFFAVISFFELNENLDEKFWKIFWRWFFGSALFVCVWCVVQCVLDVCGVPQEASLLCDGCVYRMFGFPHPNGFAIEPQFMGNLLLAPIMVVVWVIVNGNQNSTFCASTRAAALRNPLKVLLLITLLSTLFLTFSRGAIYACVVGILFLFSFSLVRAKKVERKKVWFSVLKTLGMVVVSFVFTLNLQGILAASSPTSDTYADGVAKVLNHLSLGVIDIRGGGTADRGGENLVNEGGRESVNKDAERVEAKDAGAKGIEAEGTRQSVKNFNIIVENSGGVSGGRDAVFDGYVAESTDTRVRLSKAAFDIWKKDFKTIFVGVGIGGAGQALYNNGLSPAPKEIVQNEYASLLLETGVIGVSLFVLLIVLVVRVALKKRESAGLILSLMVAYGVTLLFFSGLPNALQIVLIPGLFIGAEKIF